MNRDKLINNIEPLLDEMITKASKGSKFRYPDVDKLRISYANALANLIRAYTVLIRDKELEELSERLDELEKTYRG